MLFHFILTLAKNSCCFCIYRLKFLQCSLPVQQLKFVSIFATLCVIKPSKIFSDNSQTELENQCVVHFRNQWHKLIIILYLTFFVKLNFFFEGLKYFLCDDLRLHCCNLIMFLFTA